LFRSTAVYAIIIALVILTNACLVS
jgi:hypothetical protein